MMSAAIQTLECLEHKFSRVRALVIGDVMLDRYIIGDVERISPEAPVPVLRHVDTYARPGGAANVAMNLVGVGCQTTLLGLWGGDSDRVELEKQLRTAGVNCSGMIETDWQTISKTRIIASRQQLARLDKESKLHPNIASVEKLKKPALDALLEADVLILSDYGKGVLSQDLCQLLISTGRELGIPVLVDPKDSDFSKYAGATTVCPNLQELSIAVGQIGVRAEQLLQSASDLLVRHQLQFVTVTMSKDGITAVTPQNRIYSRAQAKEVFDVSGAGDTVIAIMAASIACKLDLGSALDLANLAAGIVVGKVGTAPIATSELISALTSNTRATSSSKVLSEEALVRRVNEWRLSGDSIVFTNGCFDLLHIGHLELFETCGRLGSKVVVGLNGDQSVRRLKGSNRPIVSENERALMVAALGAVDAVTIFHTNTPLDLIQLINPDVLVKGGDYTLATVVGYDHVTSYGGRVEIVPTVGGFSTSALARKLMTEASGERS